MNETRVYTVCRQSMRALKAKEHAGLEEAGTLLFSLGSSLWDDDPLLWDKNSPYCAVGKAVTQERNRLIRKAIRACLSRKKGTKALHKLVSTILQAYRLEESIQNIRNAAHTEGNPDSAMLLLMALEGEQK